MPSKAYKKLYFSRSLDLSACASCRDIKQCACQCEESPKRPPPKSSQPLISFELLWRQSQHRMLWDRDLQHGLIQPRETSRLVEMIFWLEAGEVDMAGDICMGTTIQVVLMVCWGELRKQDFIGESGSLVPSKKRIFKKRSKKKAKNKQIQAREGKDQVNESLKQGPKLPTGQRLQLSYKTSGDQTAYSPKSLLPPAQQTQGCYIKGVVIQEPSTTTTTTTTIYSQQSSQDKGKGIMVEELVKTMKKKDQITLDEEIAFKLQANIDEEERIARDKEEKIYEANIAWDDIQAKVDVDYQLAERLEAKEQEQFTIEQKATLFK
ncbi:hypothetical protein Tco_1058154 [Tanacetum coccineum]|uniref:Uncharacterized protein n=1 Tax=Tanacetum coccineum TaxID=301880 RepID=A0ABQ5H9A9_9ASTR